MSEVCILEISIEKYEAFCIALEKKILQPLDLTVFNSESNCKIISQLCEAIFFEEIRKIISLLNNPSIGIASLDIPESSLLNKNLNSIYGAAVVMGIFNKIGIPNIDPINQMPFAIHSASHSNAEQLDAKNLFHYTPEVKLGFHNDGLLSKNTIEIPKHIAIYNLYISYMRPGNFMWIPTASWVDADKYHQISKTENINVKIKLTPSYYLDNVGNLKNSVSDLIEAPISTFNENGEYMFFLNGQVLLEDNLQKSVDFVQEIRNSLQNNPEIIRIPQKERRAFFITNTKGFHARDVFQDPIDGVDLTRVFLRMVDLNTETFSTQ